MIGIKIKPAIELINIILSKPIPTTFNKTDEDSARIPINGYITSINNIIIAKLCMDSPSGLLRGSIRPECIPEDSLADKILTKPPLSPENKGTNVSKLGFVSKVSSELLRIPPADTPKTEHISKTGVDCLIIILFSSE